MIVCSCNVLSDQDVRAALGPGETPRTASQVYGCLGCNPQCGRCARTIRAITDEAITAACCRAGCDRVRLDARLSSTDVPASSCAGLTRAPIMLRSHGR